MLSTFLNYRLYTDNLARSLERVEASATVKRNAEYYKETIGKIETVDEFIGDFRLYSYALKAYGLGEQISAQGFVRKVLESDLSDSTSFVNRLTDPRYRAFAEAFDFKSAATPVSVQSSGQTDRLIEAYSERSVRSAVDAATKTNYYQTTIGGIRTAQQLVDDPTLFDVALRSVGVVDTSIIDRSYVRDVLTGALTPPEGSAYEKLKGQFSFTPSAAPQTANQVRDLVYDYNQITGNGASPQAAQADIDYFKDAMAGGTPRSVVELASDPRLMRFMLAAVGFEVTSYEVSTVASVLASNPADPSSYLNRMPAGDATEATNKARFRALRDLFDSASPGADGIARVTQTAENTTTIVNGYFANYKNAPASADRLATNSFRVRLPDIKSLGDLMAREKDILGLETGRRRTLEYVLKAFDIDPNVESLSKIRAALTSDPSDPGSFVSKLKDERYSKLAAVFNFGADGKPRPERVVQSTQDLTKTATLYSASFGTDQTQARKDIVRAETQAYVTQMSEIYSLDQLLAAPKVLDYALRSYGVKDTELSKAELRKILTSDLGDRASYANTHSDKNVARFAAAFNFEPDGSVAETIAGAQDGSNRLTTANLFLRQSLEELAGETNEGTRLALYFLRKAPDITSPLSILADKALFEVVRTALALPASISQLDIERQAAVLSSRIEIADFSDPKKLDKFISRFSSLYDIENGTAQASSPILALFGGGSSTGIAGLF